MKLNEVSKDDRFTVISMPWGEIGAQAIRLGLFEGATPKCIFKIENGPVLLDVGGQEVAVGNTLAEKIEVSI